MNLLRGVGAWIVFLFACMLQIEHYAMAEPPITALTVTPDGEQYVTGSQTGINVFDVENHKLHDSLDTRLSHVHDYCWSADGKFLVAAGGSPAESGEVEIYSWPNAVRVKTLRLSDDLIYRVQMTEDGKWLLASGHENECWMVSLDETQKIGFTGHSSSVMAILPINGKGLILSGGADFTIRLWAQDGTQIRSLNNHTGSVTDLLVQSVDPAKGSLFVSTGEDRTVRLWQPEIGRMVRFVRLGSIPRRVVRIADGKLVVGCDDGSVVLIDQNELKVLSSYQTKIKPIYEMVKHGDGVLVAGVGGVESVSLLR